ncbi:MAG TPA: sugar ABC transporter permease [Firmicutes bacterium]|jgi:multiple sugar transport system permease protein|nr:sugar ABC transporter permease [Bacillota bacterium]
MKKVLINNKFITWLFLLPTILFLALTAFIPLLYSLWLSFFNLKINMPYLTPRFVGLTNYVRMFGDEIFVRSTINTVIFAVTSVLFEITLGVILAMMISGESKRERVIRAVLMVPMIMAPVAAGTMWRMLLDSSTGVVNYLGVLVGLPKIGWLGNPILAFVSVIIVNVWQVVPWTAIVVISGLKGIPQDIIHSALVDGASPWRIFWKIVLPQIKPILVVVFLIRFIDAFKVFDTIYVMTGGGPGMATEMLPNYIFNQGLNYFDASYAAALAISFIVVMSLISSLFINAKSRKEAKNI